MSPLCDTCGTKNNNNNKFCINCGNSLEIELKKLELEELEVKKKEKAELKLRELEKQKIEIEIQKKKTVIKKEKNVIPIVTSVFIIALLLGYGSVWVYHPYVESIQNDNIELTNKMNEENSKFNSKISDLNKQIINTTNDFTNKISKLNINNTQLALDKQFLEDQVSSLVTENEQKTVEIKSLQDNKQYLDDRINGLQNTVEKLKDDKTYLGKEVEYQKSQTKSAQQKSSKNYDSYVTYYTLYTETKDDLEEYLDQHSLTPGVRTEYHDIRYGYGDNTYKLSTDSVFISFPNVGSCLRYSLLGGTSLETGHLIIADECFSNADIRVGDLIIYNDDGTTRITQVDARQNDGIMTSSITNVSSSHFVDYDDVTAIVIAVVY